MAKHKHHRPRRKPPPGRLHRPGPPLSAADLRRPRRPGSRRPGPGQRPQGATASPTPTCSPAPAASARPPPPASSPRRSTASTGRRPRPATSATSAAASPPATTWTSSKSTAPATTASTTSARSAQQRPVPPHAARATRSTSSTKSTCCRRRRSTPCSRRWKSRRRTSSSSSPPPKSRRSPSRSCRAASASTSPASARRASSSGCGRSSPREGMQADDEALELVARRAGGSMRDAQSLLDQLLAFGGDRLTADQVQQLLGTGRRRPRAGPGRGRRWRTTPARRSTCSDETATRAACSWANWSIS